MYKLYWPIVIITTLGLYLIILFSLLFNPLNATIALYFLIAYWSRLPGCAIMSPMYILNMADMVDLFALMISINIGGLEGGIFAVAANFTSRISGIYPEFIVEAKDSAAHFLTCIMMPFVHVLLGSNILASMVAYQALRTFWLFPMRIFPNQHSLPIFIMNITGRCLSVLAFNTMYIKLFGDLFDNLLREGVQFSWALFLFATTVIVVIAISFLRGSFSFVDFLRKVKRVKKRVLRPRRGQKSDFLRKEENLFEKI